VKSKPERLCGLQVDDQLELGRLLDRQIRGPRAIVAPTPVAVVNAAVPTQPSTWRHARR
jgi:hypothetical protein